MNDSDTIIDVHEIEGFEAFVTFFRLNKPKKAGQDGVNQTHTNPDVMKMLYWSLKNWLPLPQSPLSTNSESSKSSNLKIKQEPVGVEVIDLTVEHEKPKVDRKGKRKADVLDFTGDSDEDHDIQTKKVKTQESQYYWCNKCDDIIEAGVFHPCSGQVPIEITD
ncbi:hypothetical protein K435DRAFT_791968 [Dendrothele bispora CBS 962.96]|uniref:Uncharacterized protein n=1 Tax=Dendrothele bispora (strain CBS 962.96) TaxID=1314807 RepID=A0A4S8MKM9_DENBC|nr:hypothetical protein K435DRAFT_791968 [Dendrothele bispora CBS 962.96]